MRSSILRGAAWAWLIAAWLPSAASLAAERAAHYEEALARAKATGSDIVVFQRGSDWNRLAETLHRDVWLQEEFARELGEGFVLVAVDLPEVDGSRPLPGPYDPAVDGRLSSAPDDAPARLAKATGADAAPPVSDVVAVAAAEGSAFTPRADGAWLADGANPVQETISLTLEPARAGRLIRIDFPTDPSLPGSGPGRAANGNFAVSEVEVLRADSPIAIHAAWADAGDTVWLAIDGVSDTPDQAWNAHGHLHQRRTLLLALAEPVRAGETLAVRLVCRSPWPQHAPGCLRAAVLDDAALGDDVVAVAAARRLRARNQKFSWWDTSRCPRVALMDREGRAVARDDTPRPGLTPATLAARVKEMRAIRERRDALWARAESATGPEQAELYRQSLELLGFANWAGNDTCYAFVHDKIRKADPQDSSGAVRWLGFGGDPRDGVPWAEPNWAKALEGKDLADADFEEALARIDRELADPRNKVLDRERIQRMMIAKYHVYLRWPGREERRFDVQREIAALAPDTFWGIGARGDLGLRGRSEVPMLTYGWAAAQLRSGLNAWDLIDTAYFFDHAGPYTVRILHAGGADAVTVKKVALVDGDAVLAEASPNATLGPGHGPVEAALAFDGWRPDRKVTLRVEVEVAEGHLDNAGRFEIDPGLLPPPSRSPAQAPADEVSALLAAGRIETLADHFAAHDMPAQWELIHACGARTLARIAAREEGVAFLHSLLTDAEWLESFLASGPADWPRAVDHLAVLARHVGPWEDPQARRLATALALQWGQGLPYRLVDRFRHLRRALRDGLMHVSFETLDVRGLRWAVPTWGTAHDFQFLLDDRQTRAGDYLGAHGAIRYLGHNVYGVSVQDQWNYVAPWAHVHGNGMGNRPFPAHRQVGGVCGTLSGYGSAVAQVHGLPSTTIGQPGHCAYIIRMGDAWPVGNSVTWPSHAGAPGWEGTGYPTLHRLYERVFQDRERFMAATRLTWRARLEAERAAARVRVAPGLTYRLYREGVGPSLPDFAALAVSATGTTDAIDLAAVRPDPPVTFGVVWEGELDVARAGPVRLVLHSDDASRVTVAGTPVLETNCARREHDLPLGVGRHPLRVEFSQGQGAQFLEFQATGVLVADAAGWMKAYERAIDAQPTNYATWLEYVKRLETARDVPPQAWLALGERAARDLAVAHEAGWAIVQRCLDKVLPSLEPSRRLEILTECNRQLRQERWIKPEAFPYDGVLNWQADRIGDPALAVEFFGRLLAIHRDPRPENNWIFGSVLAWAANRFGADPATAPGYARVMEAFFRGQGSGVDANLLATTLATGIRKAGASGDIVSFRLWSDMAASLLPTPTPADVHLTPAQAEAFPTFAAFPGEVLSRDGMLRTSSACQHDRPFTYRQLLSGGFGGWFDTNAEERPWAQVQLAGEAEVTGVVLVNRYEYAQDHEECRWAVPLQVSVSLDGNAWTPVATLDKAEPVFRIDLAGKPVTARHVRVERVPDANRSQPPGRFHFRSFLVYGHKNY